MAFSICANKQKLLLQELSTSGSTRTWKFFPKSSIKRREAGPINTERKPEQAQHSPNPRPEQAQQFLEPKPKQAQHSSKPKPKQTQPLFKAQASSTFFGAHHGITATRAHPIGRVIYSIQIIRGFRSFQHNVNQTA